MISNTVWRKKPPRKFKTAQVQNRTSSKLHKFKTAQVQRTTKTKLISRYFFFFQITLDTTILHVKGLQENVRDKYAGNLRVTIARLPVKPRHGGRKSALRGGGWVPVLKVVSLHNCSRSNFYSSLTYLI